MDKKDEVRERKSIKNMPLSLHRRKQKSPRAEMTPRESSVLTSPAETDATHLLPDPTTNRFTGSDYCHTEGSTNPPQQEEDYSSHQHETDDHTNRKIKTSCFHLKDRNNWWKIGGTRTMRWIVLAVVLHNSVRLLLVQMQILLVHNMAYE